MSLARSLGGALSAIVLVACTAKDDVTTDAGPADGSVVKDAGDLKKDAGSAGAIMCTANVDPPSKGSCITITGDGGVECNPMTNAPCAAGASCDTNSDGITTRFTCYPPPPSNTLPLCATCTKTESCRPGSTCTVGTGFKCARFCCDDGDCGTGHCDKTKLPGTPIGVCVE